MIIGIRNSPRKLCAPSNLTGRLWGLGPADDDELRQAEVWSRAGSNAATSLLLAALDAEICFFGPNHTKCRGLGPLEVLGGSWILEGRLDHTECRGSSSPVLLSCACAAPTTASALVAMGLGTARSSWFPSPDTLLRPVSSDGGAVEACSCELCGGRASTVGDVPASE